jgi:hypothetical protein
MLHYQSTYKFQLISHHGILHLRCNNSPVHFFYISHSPETKEKQTVSKICKEMQRKEKLTVERHWQDTPRFIMTPLCPMIQADIQQMAGRSKSFAGLLLIDSLLLI